MKPKNIKLFCFFCCCLFFFMLIVGCGEKKEQMSDDEKDRATMIDLAQSGHYEQAAEFADRYLESGAFFPGLGLFASSVHEKLGDINKAVLYAFLDYEFSRPGEQHESNERFVSSLNTLHNSLAEQNWSEEERLVLVLVRSLFDPSVMYMSLPVIDNFVYSYIVLRNKIRDATAGFEDLREYLALEKYFVRFAPYYWGAWRLISRLDSSAISAAASCLEKIIRLNPNSSYAADARCLLSSYAGAADE